MNTKITDPNKYVAQFEPEHQVLINEVRKLVTKLYPNAVESVSYGMVGYKLSDKPLIYVGGFKDHVGVFGLPHNLDKFETEIAKYRKSKSALHFLPGDELPSSLIKKLLAARAKEIAKK